MGVDRPFLTLAVVQAMALMGGITSGPGLKFYTTDYREVTALINQLRKDRKLAWMGAGATTEFAGPDWWAAHSGRGKDDGEIGVVIREDLKRHEL